jgi:DNA repair exonuclease SbcCD nuclease subunit
MSRTPVRLLHTSDIHLAGSYHTPKAGEHLDQCLCALDALAALVDEHRVDVVMVVGDLFDHARVHEPLVAEVFSRLDDLGAPVLLLPGNHDVHDTTSPYGRFDEVVAGSGVTFLDDHDGSTVVLLDGQLTVWGKAMPEHSPTFRPLHGVPERPGDGWFVVVGHGHHIGDEEPGPLTRSSPITAGDVAATAADYVALGHWHVPSDVSAGGVTAWYSGAPLDVGRTGEVKIIDLHPTEGVSVTSVAVVPPAEGCLRH